MATPLPRNKIGVALRPATHPAPRGWRSRWLSGRTTSRTDEPELKLPFSLERVLFLLRWLVIGISLAIQLYAASGSGHFQDVARALQFTGLVAVYNGLLLAMRYQSTDRRWRTGLALADAAVISLTVGLGGGIFSPFVILLYLIIVEAALLFPPSALLTYTAFVAICYATSTMLLPGQPWNELNITILLSLAMGMFIWASVCGAITTAFEEERQLVRREQELTSALNRQVITLSAVNRLTERLNASLDVDELLQNTVQALPDALAVDGCVAFLAQQQGDHWQPGPVWYGIDEDFEPLTSPPLELDGAAGEWVQAGPLWLSHNDLVSVLTQGRTLRLPAEAASREPAVLIIALQPDEEGYGGALALLRQEGPAFTPSDQEIVAALARQLSLLIRNARLYELERRNVARLQELEQMKSDFLSTVSHEFRTPLTSIKASTLLMLSQPGQVPPVEAGRLLHNIDRNTERLNALVTDLLDMTKLQNGRLRLTPQPVYLAELASEVAATMRPLLDSKNQRLTLDIADKLPPVRADRHRIEQILNNLLSNAHRYTPKDSQIILRIAHSGPEFLLSVADNGPGIPPAEQQLVFERFYRGQRSKGGTGLGLAIARSLVELHGGRLWLESEPGAGATFRFTLPVHSQSKHMV